MLELNGKHPKDWELAEVQALIHNQVPEGTELDYKACDALQQTPGVRKEISKDVSSFANANGGIIVYGVIEHGHVPANVDDGYDPDEISQEWLGQVISSGIKPKVNDIIVKQIAKSGGKFIYVVIIPRGQTAYQASDGRYYKRYMTQRLILEHPDIEDLMGRSRYPDLEPEFMLILHQNLQYGLCVFLKNKGQTMIRNYSFEINIPRDLLLAREGDIYVEDNVIFIEEFKQDYDFSNFRFTNASDQNVIYPNERVEFISHRKKRQIMLRSSTSNTDLLKKGKFYWKLYADNMPMKSDEQDLWNSIPQIAPAAFEYMENTK